MKGILYRAELLPKVMDRTKTVTRRLDGLKEINKEPDRWKCIGNIKNDFLFTHVSEFETIKPRYSPGEIAYVKEAWRYFGGEEYEYQQDQRCVIYRHDALVNQDIYKWHNPRGMPAWAARTFLQILSVRPERLQSITNEDAIKEGCEYSTNASTASWGSDSSFRYTYQILWDSINPDSPWESNPWVFRYTFKLTTRPEVL